MIWTPPLVTPCGFRYRMAESRSAETPDWCAICERHHTVASSCPRCSEWTCESCTYWRAEQALGVLRHGTWHAERKGWAGVRWRPGPWDDEPDRFTWWHTGLPCVAIRNKLGSWCGYVGMLPTLRPDLDFESLSAHGGITYGKSPASWPICYAHDVEGYEYLGFDCGHYGDVIPSMDFSDEKSRYRTLAYVLSETDDLAEQIAGKPKREPDVA